jgi:hypothetical protein
MRRKVVTRANDTRERIAKFRLPSSDNLWQNALFCQRVSVLSGSSWSSHTGLVKPLILLEGLSLFWNRVVTSVRRFIKLWRRGETFFPPLTDGTIPVASLAWFQL